MNEAPQKIVIDPKMKGRFALYDTPDGGFHIAYQQDDSEKVEHIEVPGKIIKMAQMLESGGMNPAKMLKAMMGGQT